MVRASLKICALCLVLPAMHAIAAGTVQETRHELMEESKEAAKPVGGMLKGELDFDAAVAMESFRTWAKVASEFGALFPEGSETGFDTEAKSTIWTDREGFDEQLKLFAGAADAAIVANPQSLEDLKKAAGPVFKTCKSCHEDYRVEEEE